MLRVQSPLSEADECIVSAVVDCGYAVHRGLGPGFKEVIYARAFRLELGSRGLLFECEKPIEVISRPSCLRALRVSRKGPSPANSLCPWLSGISRS